MFYQLLYLYNVRDVDKGEKKYICTFYFCYLFSSNLNKMRTNYSFYPLQAFQVLMKHRMVKCVYFVENGNYGKISRKFLEK